MRILLVSGAAYPNIGGIENSLRYIGKELMQLGHIVKIFCFQIHTDEPIRKYYDEVEIIRCDNYVPCRWPPKNLKQFVELTRNHIPDLLEEYKPDVIWSRYAPVGLGTRLAGYKGKLVHIFSTTARLKSRGTFFKSGPMPFKRRLILLGAWPFSYRASFNVDYELLKTCEPVVFSEMMREQMLLSYGSLAEKTRVIPPGVDIDVFSPVNALGQVAEIVRRHGLDPEQKYVLFVGRLSMEKDVPMLLSAMKYIDKKYKLLIVGSGPEEKRIKDYIRQNGLSQRIYFAGTQNEFLPGFYKLAKVCVLPTLIESFGQTYLESLACGTLVVGFGGDGKRVINATNEILHDGVTGVVVGQVNPRALAAGISKILEMPESEYQKMSAEAVADTGRRFCWKKFVQEVLAI